MDNANSASDWSSTEVGQTSAGENLVWPPQVIPDYHIEAANGPYLSRCTCILSAGAEGRPAVRHRLARPGSRPLARPLGAAPPATCSCQSRSRSCT